MIQDLKEENQRPAGGTEWLHIIRKRTIRWDRREGHQKTREDRGSRVGGKKCEKGGSRMEGWRRMDDGREEGWRRAGEDGGWAGGRQRIRGRMGWRKSGRGAEEGQRKGRRRDGEGRKVKGRRADGGRGKREGGRKESWVIGGERLEKYRK